MGALLRIVIAQLFGEECANPGTVGWLAASSPLCVTKNGTAQFEGGIIFADLPSNILGSFIMGLLQNGDSLGLPVNVQLAFVNPNHVLQAMPILHLALRTGFCGSLTTFSSWNSEMVVMIFGTGEESPFLSNLIKALLGYLIGVETALGSFEFGKTVARWWNKSVNPLLHDEGLALEQRAAEGVHHNKNLPDFERRFLPNLQMENYGHIYPSHEMESLERWRRSTIESRRVGHKLLPTLIEIESAVLIHQFPIQRESESIARSNEWDVDALREWMHYRSKDSNRHLSHPNEDQLVGIPLSIFFTLPVAAVILGVIVLVVVLGVVFLNKNSAYDITDRTTCYALLFGPAGALMRWQLSKWNGGFDRYPWFPLGTFAANFIACCVSVTTIAFEYQIGNNFNG